MSDVKWERGRPPAPDGQRRERAKGDFGFWIADFAIEGPVASSGLLFAKSKSQNRKSKIPAMFIPIRTDSPLRRTPYMNWALMAANVLMFAVQQRPSWAQRITSLALDPRDPELYQFFTYQFLHGDVWHIVGNMLFLYIFGNNVNDKMGHLGYLAFYLAGGVAAGIGLHAVRERDRSPDGRRQRRDLRRSRAPTWSCSRARTSRSSISSSSSARSSVPSLWYRALLCV